LPYPYRVSEHEHPVPRPRDDTDAIKDIACDLADIAHQIPSFKGEDNAYLPDPNYGILRHGLENAHAAVEAATVEARRQVRLNEGRER
jgi:hypothetical protein